MGLIIALLASTLALAGQPLPDAASGLSEAVAARAAEGRVASRDAVEIAYTATGSGEVALVFVHCGFCDQSFWRHQVGAFADTYRVVTLDLAGHGSSAAGRREWTLAAFGEDVAAVVEALGLERVVLIGNSLGGPVSLEAARLMPNRVEGVIAVDTLHDAGAQRNEELWREQIEAFRTDFDATCTRMVDSLFHEDADPELAAWVEREMCDADPVLATSVLEAFPGYDLAAAMAGAGVPIRAINGDLYPTNLEGNRKVAPDFDVVVMEGIGHFPQLEAPEAFNLHLTTLVAELTSR